MPVIVLVNTHTYIQIGTGRLDSDSIGWFQHAAANYRI